MITIWKYPLDVTVEQTIEVPAGITMPARFLCVQLQHDVPTLWVQVDTDAPRQKFAIYIVGTGNPAEHVERAGYIGTFQQHGGALVWHVFGERIP